VSDNNGLSELHLSAISGNTELCKDLLYNSADPNIRSGELIKNGPLMRDWYWDPGATPLILALEKGQINCARLLVKLGADASLHGNYDWGALHSAVASKSSGIIELLYQHGADLDLSSTLRSFDEELSWYFVGTPLHLSALINDCLSAIELIELGASINAAWIDNRTPLFYAAARGSTEVVEVLHNYGADLNAREDTNQHGYKGNYTPLHYAASNGHRQTYEKLVELGASETCRECHAGKTPKEMAEW
jgi:ankyrin repeat protein